MNTKVRAWYANGVLMPLDPLDLEEGGVVDLDIALWHRRDVKDAIAVTTAVLGHIYQLPGSHPKKYKLLLNAEDDLDYLEAERRYRERHG